MAVSIIDNPLEAAPAADEFSHLPAWRRQDWKDDPESVLDARLEQLLGLASCVTVLGRADRTSAVADVLADDALPMLGNVMQGLAMDAIRAKDEIEARRQQVRGGLQ